MPTHLQKFIPLFLILLGQSISAPVLGMTYQSVVLINEMGVSPSNNQPILLCPQKEESKLIIGTQPEYAIAPKGQIWLDNQTVGKLQYGISYTGDCRGSGFSYVGIGNDTNGYAYVYWDKNGFFPSLEIHVSTTSCPKGASQCLRLTNGTLPNINNLPTSQQYNTIPYRGINFAGAEYTNYRYPVQEDLIYYGSKGINTIRYPIKWEFAQSLDGKINTEYLFPLQEFIQTATAKQYNVIIDLHNYMRYGNNIVGTEIPTKLLTVFWEYIANQYKNNAKVIFNLMNEPHDMDTQQLLNIQNEVIKAIRNTGATNLILLSGNDWSHLNSWVIPQYEYGKLNGNVFTQGKITDSANNFAFDVHTYFYNSGSYECKSPQSDIGLFAKWLRNNKMKAYIGEIGTMRERPSTINNTDQFLSCLENQYSDVIIGWNIWAGGRNYTRIDGYSVEPSNGEDAAQMTGAFAKHLTPPFN